MSREMKDSGVKWIGIIPISWTVMKNKYLFNIYPGATPKSDNEEYWDGDITWITPADYKTSDKYVYHGRRNISLDGLQSCNTTIVPENSIIFSKRAPIGSVAISKSPLCTNQGCLSCVNKGMINPLFAYYVMSICTNEFELLGSGTTFKELSADSFSNFYIPYPPIKEQGNITSIIDKQCSDIDYSVLAIKKTIEEYKKLKQSIITEAVTKGIRKNRPMKDSGIEWIRTIPSDWTIIKKLSYICSDNISYGIIKLLDDDEEGVKVLRCSDLLPGTICLDNIRTVKKELSDNYSRTLLKGGEVIISIRGSLGGCAVVPLELKNYNVAREIAVIRLNETILNEYVMYYLLSNTFINYRNEHLKGSVYLGLNIELLSAFPIALPPIKEQKEIVEYLDIITKKIDLLIKKKMKLIDELNQYKKSTIFEYVTGKKEDPKTTLSEE